MGGEDSGVEASTTGINLGMRDGDGDGDALLGTSKFGGAVGEERDSFDDEFDTSPADQSMPGEVEVKVDKPKRPKWGQQSFGI